MNEPTKPPSRPPSPEIIRFLIESGQEDVARSMERKWNLAPQKPATAQAGSVETEAWLAKFLTQDSDMLRMKDNVRRLAERSEPVLITGATGTGKELIARALHGRREGRFIDINCAGMPENLIESELFGYTAGAYTGAKGESQGLVGEAKDGTLFLDEVGDLGYPLQAKLLRVLQEGTYRQVGGKVNYPAKCRFIAATHWNLAAGVINKDTSIPKFRDDLYARLSMFELKTKPLTERLGDIPLILDVLDKDKKFPRNVNWSDTPLPFNVRSLQRLVLRCLVLDEMPFNVAYL